jgi:hypothetical protein
LKLDSRQYLDLHSASIWDAMVLLSPIAHGLSGTIRWTINDFEAYSSTASAITPPPAAITVTRDQRMGLWFYDGTDVGSPKPVAHVLGFIARWLREDGQRIVGPHGDLRITKAETPIHAGYTFTAPGSLFVGDVRFRSANLRFECNDEYATATNVLLVHNASLLRMMASADTHVWLAVGKLAPSLVNASVTGLCAWYSWSGDGASVELEVLMLEGEELKLEARVRDEGWINQ